MSFLFIFLCLVVLVVLITWCKFNELLAFFIVSILAGLLFRLSPDKIVSSIEKGMGDTLGSLILIICFGAMLGTIVAQSGAAEKIAITLVKVFGRRYIRWALMLTGFIIGIPLFYSIGFVLMVPLVFSIVHQYKLPPLYVGMPLFASLSVTHGFLPPHPSPTALVQQFHAQMGATLLYGMIIAVPTVIVAGPVFSNTLKKIQAHPLKTFMPDKKPEGELPGTANSFFTALLPVFLLIISTAMPVLFPHPSPKTGAILAFLGNPSIVLLVSVLVATYTLGTRVGKSVREIMPLYSQAIKDLAMILLIIAGAGALKQVLTDSGISDEIARNLQAWPLHPLVLGWLIAAIIRLCVGSATIAGLTTAGIIGPLLAQSHANPNLMVLAVGAGSLMFSHVNDSGFWLFKEYFNVSIKDTMRSWSLMETIVSFAGLAGVMLLNIFV